MGNARISKLLLVVLSLLLWTGTSYAQSLTSANPSLTFTYTKGSGTPTSQSVGITSDADGTGYTAVSADTWLIPVAGTGTANIAVGENVSYALVTSVLDHMPAGLYTTSVDLKVGGTTKATVTAAVTVTALASPLTVPTSIALTYTKGSGIMAGSTLSATVTSDDTAFDTYTVGTKPAWLTATPGAGQAKVGTDDTLSLSATQATLDHMAGGSHPFTFTLQVTGQPDLTVNGTLTITAPLSPLTVPTSLMGLTYAKGTGTMAPATVAATVNSDDAIADTYTVTNKPAWLSVVSTGTYQASSGVADTLTVSAIQASVDHMAAGSYPFSFKLEVANNPDLTVSGTLTISSTTSPLSVPTAISLTYAKGSGVITGAATVAASVVSDDTLADTYTVTGLPNWLTAVSSNSHQASVATPDTLTITANPTNADHKAEGSYPISFTLQVTGQPDLTVTGTLVITASTAPLSSPTTIALSYVKGSGTMGPSTLAVTINSDNATDDTYTVAGKPAWLNAVSTRTNKASLSQPDTLTLSVTQATVDHMVPGVYPISLTLSVASQQDYVLSGSFTITGPTPITSPTTLPIAFTYAKGSNTATSATVSLHSDDTIADTWSVGSSPAVPSWLNIASANGHAASSALPDTATLSIVTAQANQYAAGSYTFNVLIQVAGQPDFTIPVNLTITSAASPLTSNPVAVTLSYVKGAGASQPAASVGAVISSDDLAFDNYTVTAGFPTWLTVTPTTSMAKVGTTDILTFAAASAQANALAAGSTNTYTVHLAVASNPDLTVLVTLKVLAQPLIPNPTAVTLSYVKAGAVPTTTINMKVAAGAVAAPFTLNVSTVPVWLTVTGGNATANSGAGATVTLTGVDAVLKGLATGNFNANLVFTATGSTPLTIPVSLTVSNTAANISIKDGATGVVQANAATIAAVYPPSGALPTPIMVPFSTNEPISFTASCAVTSSYSAYAGATPCTLSTGASSGVSVTGVAYTWGTPVTTTFDNNLFNNGTPIGTVIMETITVTAGAQTLTLRYQYTVQPINPGTITISPTSAHQIAANTSLVVTITGTNFVRPSDILPGSPVVPTQVFVGAANTNLSASSVVISATTMMVTIPQTSIPAFPSGKTTVTLPIGVANQTSAAAVTAPTVSANLTVTTAPVIYAVTSTATYSQPAPGGKPTIAPYELISIFGANFGGVSNVNGTADAFGKFGTSVNMSGAGTTASPYVVLKVTFKTGDGKTSYSAPILFANSTQINAIVPSATVAGANLNVFVSSGSGSTPASSDAFPVSIVAADPGIFTTTSAGVGQGAILNQDGSVNKVGNEAQAGDIVAIYMTGLGAPNSAGVDAAPTGAVSYPDNCVQVSNTGKGTPGYLQVVNTKDANLGYTVLPSPAWTNIDGAVINGARLYGNFPPCMTAVPATAVTVTFTASGVDVPVTGNSVKYVGLVSGSVAGLYQVNVAIPAGLAPTIPTTVPVMVTLGTSGSSPASIVTIAVK